MLPVAVDAMGGDHAPDAIVDGARQAAESGTPVVLVGPADLPDRVDTGGLPLIEASEENELLGPGPTASNAASDLPRGVALTGDERQMPRTIHQNLMGMRWSPLERAPLLLHGRSQGRSFLSDIKVALR